MKELIQSILKAEEELDRKSADVSKEAQEMISLAKAQIQVQEREMEQTFLQEKEKKISTVYSRVKDSEEILKRKAMQEIEEKKGRLNKKKAEIKSRIISSILG